VSSEQAVRRQYEVTLPIGYTDGEGTVHRQVVLRKMTGREEAILADRKLQRNGGKLVTELLASCIIRFGELESNGRGPVTSLYSADRNYLLLRLRSRLDVTMTLDFLEHLVDLPYAFFLKRSSGDLMMRLRSNSVVP